MSFQDSEAKQLFQEIMLQCRNERRSKTTRTLRELARELDTTENYLSAIENGREFPSMKLFLRYLLQNGFNVNSLKNLSISAENKALSSEHKDKNNLSKKIYSLDHQQIQFLMQQVKVAESHLGKNKKPKKKK